MCNESLDIDNSVYVKDDYLFGISDLLLARLLKDNTTTPENAGDDISKWKNIIWATDDYAFKGEGFGFFDQITKEKITGENGLVIRPRALKSKEEQTARAKNMAEIFTPAWVCNAQINLCDNSWFERENVFNTEHWDTNSWTTNHNKIEFPDDKTWQDYLYDRRLEITCGEAPYIVSRYDAVTGVIYPVEERIGMLDRKLRIVSENTNGEDEWRKWAKVAVQSIYGYEWQGDSLLLAREAVMYSYKDHFEHRFKRKMNFADKNDLEEFEKIAEIVSWNLFQMDGLKFVIPNSCHDVVSKEKTTSMGSLFDDQKVVTEKKITPCPGCKEKNPFKHNGIYVKIMNWFDDDESVLTMVSMLKQDKE